MKPKKLLIDTLIGLTVTVVLLVVFELGLWALGVEGTWQSARLSAGFDAGAAYFVPDVAAGDGAYRTQFLNTKVPDRSIAKKSNLTRVLLFGGSNTAGFPPGWLRRELNACGQPERFEVINLGRPGFGSARVAIIFEQALTLLDPDIVFVYTGHNEFVERGFKMDLDAAWSSGLTRALVDLVSGSRTVALAASFFGTRQRASAKPQDWKSEYEKFAQLQYSETLTFFEAYEQNLRHMARLARAKRVPLVLSTVVHNRFAAPFVASSPLDMAAEERAAFDGHLAAARAAYPHYFQTLLPAAESDRVHQFDWGPPGKQDLSGESGRDLPGRRECSGVLAERDPLWRLESHWKPKVRVFYEALAALFAREVADSGALELAERELESAIAIDPTHAGALFEMGLVRIVLARPHELIKAALDGAGRFDRAPRKANGLTNDIVRRVASEFDETLLLDADGTFAQRAPAGLMGWEWMTDHCHLSLGAMRILMEDLAAFICERRRE